MSQLTIIDFINAFEKLTSSLDYMAMRQINKMSEMANTAPVYPRPLTQILSFSLKWQLAFNQFPLEHAIHHMDDMGKIRILRSLMHLTQHLEISEQAYYQHAFNSAIPDNAYQLSEKPDWAIRFLYIFKTGRSPLAKATEEKIIFFINLLTMLSVLVNFIPSK